MGEKQVFNKSECMIKDSVNEASEIGEANIESKEYEVKECTDENLKGCEFYDKQEASSGRDLAIVTSQKPSSPLSGVVKNKVTVPKTFMSTRSTMGNSDGSDVICSPKASSMNSPRSVKSSQMNSPTLSRRLFRGDDKKSHEEDEDCWSLTSSAAGSVKSSKYKTTVASAPVFKCTERAEKRKEFYKKLEEKHRALEEERKQFEARIKEEQDAVLKQLRKNMTYKANPVPDFYRQGPPRKPEPKKLPVTRPKSPKFNTSRRRSNSNVAESSQVEEKVKVPTRSVCQETRKIQSNGRSRVSVSSSKATKTEAGNSPPCEKEEHDGSDVSVES